MTDINYKIANKDEFDRQRIQVASIDKELKDYQSTMSNVNVNQEAKQKVNGYGTVSLPKNCANGQVSVGLKGETATNLIKNGNFSDGTLNWGQISAVNTIENGLIVNTSIASQYPALIQDINVDCETEKKIFARAIVTSIDSPLNISLNLRGTTSTPGFQPFATVHDPVNNQQYILNGIVSILSTQIGKVRISINHSYSDGVEGRKIKVVSIMAIELAGEDLNLTPEQLDAKYANYFDGTKSTISASRLKSVGKNLFGGKMETGGLINDTGKEYTTTTTIRSESFFPVQSNIEYRISNDLNYIFHVHEYDINKKWLGYFGILYSGRFTTSINTKYIKFRSVVDQIDTNVKIQIEKGTAATPYEPYTESTQYLPNVGELRSLPSAKDEVRVSGGKAEHVRRNQKYTVKSDENLILAFLTNVDVYRVVLSNNSSFGTDEVLKLVVDGKQLVPYTNRDSVDNIGKYYTTAGANSNSVFFLFPKGTTLEQARTVLAGLELTYQLAEPIITPIQTSGVLLSYPSGTIYAEKSVADAGVYNSGISVLNQGLPIKEIESLSKVAFTSGLETSLDASKSVIPTDRLSFTHPDLVDGDIVFFTYFYDVESTQGELEVEYYDSRHTLKDSVTGKFYKIVPTVADGVLTNSLEEV